MKKKTARTLYWGFILTGPATLIELERWAWYSGLKPQMDIQGIICVTTIILLVGGLLSLTIYILIALIGWIKENK